MDLDTFLTTLYVLVDDWYKGETSARFKRHAGPALQMSDSEVLTVAIAGQWRVGVPWRSERGIVRYMLKHGRSWFPSMLKRSQFNQRVRDLWTVLYACSRSWRRCSEVPALCTRWWIVRRRRIVAWGKPSAMIAIGSLERKVTGAIMAAGITESNCCSAPAVAVLSPAGCSVWQTLMTAG